MGLSRKQSSDIFTVNEFVIDATEVAQKFITLSRTPINANQVLVDVQGGTAQKTDVDFQVVANKITWAGLGLEVQIGIGDFLRVTFT